jgi:hypothetical protein
MDNPLFPDQEINIFYLQETHLIKHPPGLVIPEYRNSLTEKANSCDLMRLLIFRT